MSVDLEDKLAAMGIMNAPAYAKKFAEDEWTWEALVGCSDEKLDVLVQRVGMKEGSALTFKGRVRDAREQARLAPAAPAPDDAHQSPPAWKSTRACRGRPVAAPSSGEEPASVERYAPRTGAGRIERGTGRRRCRYERTDAGVRPIEWASVERRGTGIAVAATPDRAANRRRPRRSVRVHGAAARETDGGRCFAEGCRWLYGFGEGVDYTEAASYLKRGAQLGHALSAAHLASILMEGKGVRGNPRAAQLEATMWAMRSCDAMGLNDQAAGGDAGARLALGLLLQAGIGCEMNQALAVNHFRAAAMAGDAVAMNCLAGAVEEGLAQVDEPDATAADWYRKAAEAGVVQAQSNYGLALMQGRGVPRDEKAAVDWFVRAADQGDPDVQNWLGLCYQDGRCGVLIDDAEAARWYMRAADSGDADAQAELGAMYKEGRGVEKDDEKALDYFMTAADAGSQAALDELRNRGLTA